MRIFLKDNKVALKLEHGDDFKLIIEKIKTKLSPYSYDPQEKIWFTEKMNLLIIPELFSQINVVFDPQIQTISQKQKQFIEELKLNKEKVYSENIGLLKDVNLFNHQRQAINFMLNYSSCGLFDEQGLGKTLTTISTLCVLFEQQKIEMSIIICPNNLKYNWKNEIDLFSGLSSIILEGSKKEKMEQLKQNCQVIITNYESLIVQGAKKKKKEKSNSQLISEEFQKEFLEITSDKTCIVLDESHRIKNGNSSSSKYVRKLGTKTNKKYVLTGTPIANHPEDIFYQFLFLDGGKLFGTNYYSFLKQYCYLGNQFSKYAVVGYKNLDKLRFLIGLKSIRRLKEDVLDLPEKIFEDRIIETSKEHMSFYNDLLDKLIQIITEEGELKSVDPYLVKLIQCASNPILIDQNSDITSSKIKELDELLNEHIVESGNKVILWTNYVDNYPYLLERYKKYNPFFINGEVKLKERHERIKQFQTNPEVKMIICNPQACKEGITLTASCVAIYLDRDYVLVNYKQSVDRLHRIGQSKTCLIINLICKDTIDEMIMKNLFKKDVMAQYLQGDCDDLSKLTIISNRQLLEKCIKERQNGKTS